MKIGLFTDSHYCKAERLCETRCPSLSLHKIQEAMDAFRRDKADICFCLGDLTDHAPTDTKEDVAACYREVMELIHSYGIPFYVVPGNHDYLMMRAEEMVEQAGFVIPPYVVDGGEYNFILLDANYRENMIRFDVAGVEWTDSNLPPEQVEFLRESLAASEKECIVLVHENLDPYVDERHIIKNASEVRAILKGAIK